MKKPTSVKKKRQHGCRIRLKKAQLAEKKRPKGPKYQLISFDIGNQDPHNNCVWGTISLTIPCTQADEIEKWTRRLQDNKETNIPIQ